MNDIGAISWVLEIIPNFFKLPNAYLYLRSYICGKRLKAFSVIKIELEGSQEKKKQLSITDKFAIF